MAIEACTDDLEATQTEVDAVKKAVRQSSTYLGMSGETLQRYLLQMTEKENLLLSHKLRISATQADAPSDTTPPAEDKRQDLMTKMEAFINSSDTNGSGPAAEDADPICEPAEDSVRDPAEVTDVKPPPEGDVQAFNKESLPEVVRHLCEYEAVPLESAKAL